MKFYNKIWERKLHKKATSERQHSLGMRKIANATFPNLIHLYFLSFPYSSCTLVIQEEIRKTQVYHQGNSQHRIPSLLSCMFNISSFHKKLCTCTWTRIELVIFCLIVSSSSRHELTKKILSFHEKQILWSAAANICSF